MREFVRGNIFVERFTVDFADDFDFLPFLCTQILHPQILAQYIRPQEPHLDLLFSLMTESSITHFRRICASMLVYLGLLFLYAYLPMLLARNLFGSSNADIDPLSPPVNASSSIGILELNASSTIHAVNNSTTFQSGTSDQDYGSESVFSPILHFCYLIPQIQIPLELAIAHLTFLTVLDKRKNIIGKLQHTWLVWMCKLLGLSKFILPHQIRGRRPREGSAGMITTGPPMRRPPPGWDARTNRNTTRWAWGTEPLSELEQSVAPRKQPEGWIWRTTLLLISSWALVCGLVLIAIFVPVVLGRLLLRLLQVPSWITHEPVCFLLGGIICASVLSILAKCNAKKLIQYAKRVQSLPLHVAFKAAYMLFSWVATELSVGCMIHVAISSIPTLESTKISLWFVISVYMKGALSVGLALALIYAGSFDRFVRRLGIETEDLRWARNLQMLNNDWPADMAQVHEWSEALRQEMTKPFLGFELGLWREEEARLSGLQEQLVWPMFKRVVLKAASSIVLAGVCTYTLARTVMKGFVPAAYLTETPLTLTVSSRILTSV